MAHINKVKITFNTKLLKEVQEMRKKKKEKLKTCNNPEELSDLYKELRDNFRKKYGKKKYGETMPVMFSLSCLTITNLNKLKKKSWEDVIPYLKRIGGIYESDWSETTLYCCCGHVINNYIIYKNKSLDYHLILGSDCALKNKIINENEYKKIKKKQDKSRDLHKLKNKKADDFKNRKFKEKFNKAFINWRHRSECKIIDSDEE